MNQPEGPYSSNNLGPPPEGVFVQLNLQTDGRVTYRFNEDPASWPQTTWAMFQLVGAVSTLGWQLHQWATDRMRGTMLAYETMKEWLAGLPEGKVN